MEREAIERILGEREALQDEVEALAHEVLAMRGKTPTGSWRIDSVSFEGGMDGDVSAVVHEWWRFGGNDSWSFEFPARYLWQDGWREEESASIAQASAAAERKRLEAEEKARSQRREQLERLKAEFPDG